MDISSWLAEADQIDRSKPVVDKELETRQIAMEDTTRVEGSTLNDVKNAAGSTEPEEDKVKRPDRRAPIKLPKQTAAPLTGNTKDAATETLKKYFGGR